MNYHNTTKTITNNSQAVNNFNCYWYTFEPASNFNRHDGRLSAYCICFGAAWFKITLSVRDCVDPVINSLFDRSEPPPPSPTAVFKLLFETLMSVYLFASFLNLSANDKEFALSRSNKDFLPKCRGDEVREEGSLRDSVADTDVSMSAGFWDEGTLAWKLSGGRCCWFCIEWFL